MREFKESGIDWIGKTPVDWQINKIKNVLIERKEKNKPIKTSQILSLTKNKGVILYSEKGNIGNKSKNDLTDYKLAYPEDIIINSMNIIIGSVGLNKYFGAVSPVYYMLYKKNKNELIEYYNFIFQTEMFQKSLIGYGNGIMELRMRIKMSTLSLLRIPTPPISMQNRIVNFLNYKVALIDNIISKTKKSIEYYKQYKQSLITEVVTKGLNPNTEMKESGIEWIGKIPKDWEVIKLKYIGKCQNGISKSGKDFGFGSPFVSYSDVYNNFELPKITTNLVNSSLKDQINYSVQFGDIFFTRTSETIEELGLSAVCTKTLEKATFAGFVIRVRPKKNIINPIFAKYYFRNSNTRNFIIKETHLVTRASLSQELLKRFPILIPSIEEQVEISNFLEKKTTLINNIIGNKEFEIKELENYKKSLIFEVVTGKKEIN